MADDKQGKDTHRVSHRGSSPASSAQPSERKEGVPAFQLRPCSGIKHIKLGWQDGAWSKEGPTPPWKFLPRPRQRPRVSTEKRRVSSDLNLGHQLHSKSVSIESCDESWQACGGEQQET